MIRFLPRIIFSVLLTASYLAAQPLTPVEKLYDDTHVARIDITINPAFLAYMYANPLSDSMHQATFKFQNNHINETVESIGFRLRGNTSRWSKKKSFKVSFNDFVPGREFYGVDKLNLNGEHNDPSIIRSKLSFDLFRKAGIIASRASHAAVYINGQYYGLYVSVEHIDDEFLKKNFADDSGNLWKCLYGADLQYLGSSQQPYKDLNNNGTPSYELTQNEETGDYYQLVRLITLLNKTPSGVWQDSLENFLDVKTVLQYLALNLLLGGWDDYWSLMNNYYLYHNPTEDKFTLIPYDYDNTFGVDWSGHNWTTANPYNRPKVVGGPRPLAEKLMANPQYRNLYTRFLQFYRDNLVIMPHWDARLDSLRASITSAALADSFRTLDYGFTSGDFFNSYNATPYSNQHVKYGIRQFVNARTSTLPAQLSYQSAGPIVYDISISPENPGPGDSVYIYASGFTAVGIAEMSVHFLRQGAASAEVYPMQFRPVPGSFAVEDADRYAAVLPPLGANGAGTFKVYIRDAAGNNKMYPRVRPVAISAGSITGTGVVINEFMADNAGSVPDPAGQADDWLELYNPTNAPVLLTGKYLTDNPGNRTKWRIGYDSLYIQPGQYLIVWCDEDLNQPGVHANFKLSKSGEYLALVDSDGQTIIDSVTFGPQRTDTSASRTPDAGIVWSFTLPTPGAPNSTSSAGEVMTLPEEYTLTAYPNPFNPETVIGITVPAGAEARLMIYDIMGREIRRFSNEESMSGSVVWNGKDDRGNAVAAGIYIAMLRSEGRNMVPLKLMLLK